MKAEFGAVGRWVRQLARPERLRVVVAIVGVLLLSAIGSLVLVAEGSTGSEAVPLTDAQRAALTEAARSCPALTAPKLAAQIMATTGFEATADGGIAGLTAAEWEIWKPWEGAVPSDDSASILAVAHLTCDLVGRLRRDGFAGDQWRLAIAAFATSLDQVRASAGVPADQSAFVEQVEEYAAWYATQWPPAPTPPDSVSTTTMPASPSADPDASPSASTEPTASASPTPSGSVTTSPTPNAGPTTTPAPVTTTTTTTTTAPPPPPPLSLNFPSFSDASALHLNGSARVLDGRLALTTGLQQAGSAWSKSTLDTSRSFTVSFRAVVSQPTDGLAFVVQAEGPAALGALGGAIGYGGTGDQPIRPSVAVEIDTWDNSPDGYDPAGHQHLAVTHNGDPTRHLIWADPGFDMRNNQPFSVWITYNAGTRALSVYASQGTSRPAQPLFVHTIDLRGHLGADRAYIGFTGGTGLTNLTESRESVLSWSASSS